MDQPGSDTEDTLEEGQLVARGHAAGDVLEAWNWRIVERSHGLLILDVDLPDSLRNPQGQLFGGFTPTYIDFASIFTLHTLDLESDPTEPRSWVTTINMRCDYFEPIVGPTFGIRGEIVNQRGKNALVSTKFFQDGVMAAHALTTLRQMDLMTPNLSEPPAD
ncbi:MAG: PaaI family thioesterase [Actinomycetota bacterium]